jgi:UDP-glucose 6-dehydrogenase
MISDLCDYLPGADVDVVTATLGLDSRIGSKYLKGAVAFGGPCFPRDNRALAVCARENKIEPCIPEATDKTNELHLQYQMEDFVNAFGAIYYAHGWIDCGARLKIFNVTDDKLFTI